MALLVFFFCCIGVHAICVARTTFVVHTVQKLIASNKLPHLLFYGPPGTGKTSTILACAKKLYGADFKMMVLEVRWAGRRFDCGGIFLFSCHYLLSFPPFSPLPCACRSVCIFSAGRLRLIAFLSLSVFVSLPLSVSASASLW